MKELKKPNVEKIENMECYYYENPIHGARANNEKIYEDGQRYNENVHNNQTTFLGLFGKKAD